ncbi:unnamed protein product [Lampetra fluviatilis]
MEMISSSKGKSAIKRSLNKFFPSAGEWDLQMTLRDGVCVRRNSVKFRRLVHKLLQDATYRQRFLQEEMEAMYGERYLAALEVTLLQFVEEIQLMLPRPHIDRLLDDDHWGASPDSPSGALTATRHHGAIGNNATTGTGNNATIGTGNNATTGTGNDVTGTGNNATTGTGNNATTGTGNNAPSTGNNTTIGTGNNATTGTGNNAPSTGNNTTIGTGNNATTGTGNNADDTGNNATTGTGNAADGNSAALCWDDSQKFAVTLSTVTRRPATPRPPPATPRPPPATPRPPRSPGLSLALTEDSPISLELLLGQLTPSSSQMLVMGGGGGGGGGGGASQRRSVATTMEVATTALHQLPGAVGGGRQGQECRPCFGQLCQEPLGSGREWSHGSSVRRSEMAHTCPIRPLAQPALARLARSLA